MNQDPGSGSPANDAGLPPATDPDAAAPPGPAVPQYGPPAHEPRRRLHPLSPLLRGGSWLAASIVALSWNTLGQVGVGRFVLIVVAMAVGAIVVALVAWLNTGYHLVGRELRIQDGLLWRRNRAIPLERLQSVELVRPLIAQLTGLAELRLEVVGGGKTEAPLAYLTVREATALRERLLTLAGCSAGAAPQTSRGPATDATAGQWTTAGPTAAAPAERALHAVSNRDLLISQLLTPQAFLLPVGMAFVVAQFAAEGSRSFIGIASTITAMAGVLLQPARRVLHDWNFRLAHDPDGRLRVRYGLLETRSQTVPLHRVQSLGATWPLLWRGKKWLHLRLDIAGLNGPQPNDENRSDRLLPVGDPATARALVWQVLPGVDLAALPMSPPPPRARWLHPFALRSLGAGLTDQVFMARWGLLTRELTMVPYARMQSVRVTQGPLQRRLRLATVYADTAGGRSCAARDRDLAQAWALALELTTRSGLARQQNTGQQHTREQHTRQQHILEQPVGEQRWAAADRPAEPVDTGRSPWARPPEEEPS